MKASLGLLDEAARDRLRPEERRLMENARRNVDRLTSYIGDLLALNQLEAGVLPLDPEPLDLREVVAAALTAVQPLIAQKEQQLTLSLPAPLPVDGDRRRLEQVVVNLLANAHEHTPAGTSITISGQTTLETALVVANTAQASRSPLTSVCSSRSSSSIRAGAAAASGWRSRRASSSSTAGRCSS